MCIRDRCQTEGCTAKTDVAAHSGGQATCQKKAECEVCSQEYGAVSYTHLTPDNIFITKSGELKVLDFGSARYSALAQNKIISVIVEQGYAPPEQ